MARRWRGVVVAVVGVLGLGASVAGSDSAAEIFSRRILPLARAEKPSSCAECHAAGVDLSQYIKSDGPATFAALAAAGLVNAEEPRESKLLAFIRRQPEKPDPALARLRAEELAAFTAWIVAAAQDPPSAAVIDGSAATPVGPTLPTEIIRHARRDRVLASFLENIWIERERCAGCHSPEKNQRLIKEHGEHISWISPDDPSGTLATIIDHGLIDLEDPNRSLILQKPLNEVEHGGHVKFAKGTRTDKQFRRFLTDYAATVRGKYQSTADLPAPTKDVYVATAQHLRLIDVPVPYDGKLVRIDLYRWTGADWSAAPVASVDGMVNPKNHMFQGVVFAILPRMPDLAKELQTRRLLPGGRYLAKLYVDREGKLTKDRDDQLGQADFAGQVEFDGDWPAGYQPPKIVAAPALP